MMNKYYFTFMLSHPLRDYVQVIIAKDMETAIDKMLELYGKDWGVDYTEEQWVESHQPFEDSPGMMPKTELPYVYCEPVMTTGEMFAWINRLNNIFDVGGPLKIKRLNTLVDDLEIATDIENDRFARSLYLRVQEEVNGYGQVV